MCAFLQSNLFQHSYFRDVKLFFTLINGLENKVDII